MGRVRAGSLKRTDRHCINAKHLTSSEFCHKEEIQGIRIPSSSCVRSIEACASLAFADADCGPIISYFGDIEGPSGGACSCLRKNEDCVEWPQVGAVLALVVDPTTLEP